MDLVSCARVMQPWNVITAQEDVLEKVFKWFFIDLRQQQTFKCPSGVLFSLVKKPCLGNLGVDRLLKVLLIKRSCYGFLEWSH